MLELLESRWLPNNLLSAWQSPFPDADLPPAFSTPVEEPLLLLNPIPDAAPPARPSSYNPGVQIVAPSVPAPNPSGIDVSANQPAPAPSGIDDPLARMLTFWDGSPQPPAARPLAGIPPIAGGSKAAPAAGAVPPPRLATVPTTRASSATTDSSGSTALLAPRPRSASPSAPVITGGSGTPFQAIEAGLASFYPLSPAGVNPILHGVESVGLNNVATTFFQDADPNGAVADFSASINWGDGTAADAGTVGAAAGGGFSVTGSHTFSEEGTFTVTTTITDLLAKTSTSGAATAVVADPSITPSPVDFKEPAGTTANVTLATFTDPDPQAAASDYQATLAWGDGATSSGSVSADPQGGFDVTGSHAYMQPGRYAATATITEGMPGYGGRSQTVSASAVISDPAFTAGTVSVSTAAEGGDSRLTATFTDGAQPAPPSSFTAAIDCGDGDSQGAAVVQNGAAFQIGADHTYLVAGAYTPTVKITDPEGDVVTESGTAVVADAPLSATGATAYAGVHSSANLATATFTDADPNAGPSSYAATIACGDGATGAGVIAESSGVFTVTGTHSYAMTGTFAPTTTIQDKTSTATATGSVIVSTVTATPQVVNAAKGVSSVLTLATFTDSATGADAARIDWGDGTTPTAGTVGGASGNYSVSGSHSYAAVGSYTAKVTLTTAAGQTSIVAVPVAVTDGPLSAAGTSFSAAQGVDTGSVVVATFTAADPNAAPSDFAATVDWGDGAGPLPPSTITQSGATFSVIGDYTYLNQGTFAVAVTITDGGGATATTTSTAMVGAGPINPTAVPINTTEGIDPGNITVATFTGDANGATIDWGDGSAATTGTVANGAVAGGHTYAEAGTYTVNVTLTDASGYTVTTASTATVADAALTAGALSFTSATEGQSFSGTVATFSDANPTAAAGDLTATIDWGDGVVLNGAVSASNGTFTVSGNNTYFQTGSFPVRVSVVDADGNSVAVSGSVAATDAALLGSPNSTLNATAQDLMNGVVVAQFSDPSTNSLASDYTVTINWGDGTPSTAGVVQGSDGNYAVVGSHTYVQASTYTIQVTVSDPGGSATFVGSANVQPPPTYGLANFSSDYSGFTAMVDWGDQTPQTPAAISGGPSEYHVSSPHSYAEEGSYNAIVYLYYQGVVVASFGAGATVIDGPMQAAITPHAAVATPTATLKEVDYLHALYIHDDHDAKKVLPRKWTADRFTPASGMTSNVDKNGPIGYVSGKVDLLAVDIAVNDPDSYKGQTVTLIGHPNWIDIPIIQGTATLKDGVLESTDAKITLPKLPEVFDPLRIDWFVLPANSTYDATKTIVQQSADWLNAGASSDTLYATYKASVLTEAPMFLTEVDVGTRAAEGATSDDEVIKDVNEAFETLEVHEAPDPTQGARANPGPIITYWNDWIASNKRNNTTKLLADHDGNCVGWTLFYEDTLRVQGIKAKGQSVKSKVRGEKLFVAAWNAAATPNSTDPTYLYSNTVPDRSRAMEPTAGDLVSQANGKWNYNWVGSKGIHFDVDPTKYLNAQGESVRAQPPLALFKDHVIDLVTLGGQTAIFDPSYGKLYENPPGTTNANSTPAQLQAALQALVVQMDQPTVIPFYGKVDLTPVNGNWVFLIRPNKPAGQTLIIGNIPKEDLLP
jgi:hypothetical protein